MWPTAASRACSAASVRRMRLVPSRQRASCTRYGTEATARSASSVVTPRSNAACARVKVGVGVGAGVGVGVGVRVRVRGASL